MKKLLTSFIPFCRVDSGKSDDRVRGTKRLLTHEAVEGDLIIYGKFEPKGAIPPLTPLQIAGGGTLALHGSPIGH